jgi:hypothetical protein
MQDLGIRFEACPLSDIAVYPDEIPALANHKQFKKLLEANLVTLNSDDPGFFGDINQVYQQVFEALNLSFTQLLQCTSRGINPASSTALKELEEFKQNDYLNYRQIQKVGEFKIQFFMMYWTLLTLLNDHHFSNGIARKIIVIDLKTAKTDLVNLKEGISQDEPMLLKALGILIEIKAKIEKISGKINEKTESLFSSYSKEIGHSLDCCC